MNDPAANLRWGSVELRDRDRYTGLQWMGGNGHEQTFTGPVATPEQVSALERIDALLTD